MIWLYSNIVFRNKLEWGSKKLCIHCHCSQVVASRFYLTNILEANLVLLISQLKQTSVPLPVTKTVIKFGNNCRGKARGQDQELGEILQSNCETKYCLVISPRWPYLKLIQLRRQSELKVNTGFVFFGITFTLIKHFDLTSPSILSTPLWLFQIDAILGANYFNHCFNLLQTTFTANHPEIIQHCFYWG